MKKYKALICDVDGTLIPNTEHGMPSEAVKKAIEQAATLVHVGVATSRSYKIVHHITEHLNLQGPSIINGGAKIMNLGTGEMYVQHKFTPEEIELLNEIVHSFHYELIVDSEGEDLFGGYVTGLSDLQANELKSAIQKIPTISVHKIPAWQKGAMVISVGPGLATKQHGIEEISKILDIPPQEIIGVGDGYNDFPLLMACGLKVAMGNAVDELKAIADYIAPTVENDGVVDIINKFILN